MDTRLYAYKNVKHFHRRHFQITSFVWMEMETSKENMSDDSSPVVSYSWQIGFVYVFNLIVGAGLLALPKAFAETGWLLGLICLSALAIISYITVTFTIEAMSLSNAMLRHKSEQEKAYIKSNDVKDMELIIVDGINTKGNIDCTEINGEMSVIDNPYTSDVGTVVKSNQEVVVFKCSEDEVVIQGKYDTVLNSEGEIHVDMYDITVSMELGDMSRLFFYKAGVILYYVSVSIYLYGGLSIYAAAISKSLTTVVCGDAQCFVANVSSSPCPNIRSINIQHMYRIMLAIFVLLICPFAFFDIANTKILQIFTTTYRWLAMVSMVILAFMKIGKGEGENTAKLVVFENLPNFFGVAVYAFMCQHSIPAVLTPVSKGRRLHVLVMLDFACVIVFYATILLSAVFAFPTDDLQDLYTLNFVHPAFFKYALQLFPVFTLSANFPILAIVLRDNLKKLMLTNSAKDYGLFLRRILFPVIVIIPPICVAYFTYDVGMLVGYTGTYAGTIIQYVIPTTLVYCGRRQMMRLFGVYQNKYQSPFRHPIWIVLVMSWYGVCLVFVTYNKIKGT